MAVDKVSVRSQELTFTATACTDEPVSESEPNQDSTSKPASKSTTDSDTGIENSLVAIDVSDTSGQTPNQITQPLVPKSKSKRVPLIVSDLTDEVLLVIISFVEMGDILNVLLSCRHLCGRVYGMFEIAYTDVVKEEWCNSKPMLITDQVMNKTDENTKKTNVSKQSTGTTGTAVVTTSSAVVTPAVKESKIVVDPGVASTLTSSIVNVFSSFGVTPVTPVAAAVGSGSTADTTRLPLTNTTNASSGLVPHTTNITSTNASNNMLTPEIVDELTKKLTRTLHICINSV